MGADVAVDGPAAADRCCCEVDATGFSEPDAESFMSVVARISSLESSAALV